MVNFSKLFALSLFAAMTTAVIGQLGEDYCTYSPDTDCYVNGKPECCLDDSSECPEEEPPCNVVSSPSPTTPSPTSVPVPLPGADYCTYSPDTDCYVNGKPECCLDDSTDCTEEQPPCDVVNSPSPTTPSPTAAPVPLLGADYCTYAPDTGCYINGKPECCLDDSTDCTEEQPPCNVVNSPSPTAAPVPLPGADYCTYAPDAGCYMNGKPECCLDDSIDCTEEQPPCDVVNSPSPTTNPTAAPVPLPGADYCTYAPDTGCYMNGKPECCLNDSDCPDQQPPCDVTPPPTPLPSPGLTQPPTPLPTNSPSRRPTLEPTNSPTDRPTGRPTKNGDTPFPTFKSTPQPTEKPTNRPTNNPTKKGETSPPTVTPDFASCEANEACKSSGLEGQCCPTVVGDFLGCCAGTSDSYSLKASSVSLCVSAIATLFVVFLL